MGNALSYSTEEEDPVEGCLRSLRVLGANTAIQSQILLTFNWTCGSKQCSHFAVVENKTKSITFLPQLLRIEAQGMWMMQDNVAPKSLGIESMRLYSGESAPTKVLSSTASTSWHSLIQEHINWIFDLLRSQEEIDAIPFPHIEDGAQSTYTLFKEHDSDYAMHSTVMREGVRTRREWSTTCTPATKPCCGTIALSQVGVDSLEFFDSCKKITPSEFYKYLEERKAVLESGSVNRYRAFLRGMRKSYALSYELYLTPIDE